MLGKGLKSSCIRSAYMYASTIESHGLRFEGYELCSCSCKLMISQSPQFFPVTNEPRTCYVNILRYLNSSWPLL